MTRVLAAGVAAGALAAAVSGFAGATGLPSSATGIAPVYREGSSVFRDCAAATGEQHIMGLKLTKSQVGSYNGSWNQTSSGVEASHKPDNPMQVTVSGATVSGGAATFGWSANMPLDYVIVKAGNGAIVYDYTAHGWGGRPATGPWGDTGLVSPKDSISHVLFCTIKKLRVEKTAVGAFDRQVDWTIDKQIKAEDAEYGANATITLVEGDSGTATWKITTTRTSRLVNPSVRGAITVLNTSPFSAEVSLSESLAGAAFGSGCPVFTLARGTSKTCEYSATLPAAEAGLNTVQAKAKNLSWMQTATASAPYAFDGAPVNELDGTVSWDDSNGRTRDAITASDTFEYQQSVDCDDEGLKETQSREIVNTVTLHGTGERKLGEDTATLRVECAPATKPLLVAKTADLHWKRVTSWDVAKSASPGVLSLMDGATGATTWSIDVTRRSVESYFLVAGSITVKNPNAYDVPGVTIAESLQGAEVECGLGDSAKTPATATTIPAGATLNCTYTAAVAENAAGVNHVEVTSGLEDVDGSAEDAWEALERPDAGDVNASVSLVDARLARSWTATSSEDDRQFGEALPCTNAAVVNAVELLGDDPSTAAVETNHVLARASAEVTTTCGTTPKTPETPQTPVTPLTPVAPQTPVAPVGVLVPPLKAPVAKPKPKPAGKPIVKGVVKKKIVKPVAKPKPVVRPRPVVKRVVKAKAVACVAIGVSTRTVGSDRRSTVTIVASAAGKALAGARVRLVGPGILKVVRTGAAGRVKTSIRPSRAGIVEVEAAGRPSCSGKRIGVIAPFEPPLTG